MTEQQAATLGNEIIAFFGLPIDNESGKVTTSYGMKSAVGIGLFVEHLLQEQKDAVRK